MRAIFLSLLLTALPAIAQTWGPPVWSDEFSSAVAGAPPDSAMWVYDVGAHKWGNQELETYCAAGSSDPAPCDAKNPNVYQDGEGHLVIQALRTSTDPAPTGTWTSGRLKTRGLHEFQYGRLEACMRLPSGAGLWPAFWLLGTVGTGFRGEIDIMENVPKMGQPGGLGPTVVETTIHGAMTTGPRRLFSLAEDVTLPNAGRVDDTTPACHVYGAIWSPSMIQVYVDDWRSPFFLRTAADTPPGGRWVFDAPNRFYFLLNVAVGGQWPGPPDATTPSPAKMLVDYVRVYQNPPTPAPTITASPAQKDRDAMTSTLTLERGVNRVYVACSGAPEGATCAVDTGNSLNRSVVDFSSGATQRAAVTLKNAAPGSYHLSVTASSISGAQSTVSVPVTVE